MARRVVDETPEIKNKGRIYEVTVKNIRYNANGPRVTYTHTIKFPGWEEFFDEGVL